MTATRTDDQGFTFVELLAASLLTVGVLAVSGWILLASLNGGKDVTASGIATSEAQVLATSVRETIGSSDHVSLGSFAGTGQLLKATYVAFDDNGAPQLPWACVYWAVTDDGRAYTKRTPSAAAIPTAQDASGFGGWMLLASGLERTDGATPILSLAGTTVSISARSDAEGGAPAVVETSVTQRPLPVDPGGLTC